MAVMNFTRIY